MVGGRFFSEYATAFNPAQIPSNQKLIHFCVMCVFHRNWLRFEAMPLRKGANLLGIIVGQQEVATELFAEREQTFVVNLAMRVESRPGAFAASGVRRINEKYSVPIILKMREFFKSIAVFEFDAVCYVSNVRNPLGDGLWIPAREYAFSVVG